MSLRKQDYQSENAVAEFLNRNFYPFYATNLVRYSDQLHQFKGIDLSLDFNSRKGIMVDEKSAAHYTNKNIPTFAFEIDFIGSDREIKPGWLFDLEKQTQFYLLSWIWASKDRGFSASDISKVEVILVERRSIVEYLAKNGLDAAKAARIASSLRQSASYGRIELTPPAPFYFYHTEKLTEKPINVILRKSVLSELAVLHEFITPI